MADMVSVVFDNYAQAETATNELRTFGVKDSDISMIAQETSGKTVEHDGGGEKVSEKTGDAVKGAIGGGALGAILGVAALAIPGVGPLVGLGAIAATAIPGAALTGAAVGAGIGGIASFLTDHGVDKDDATYFEKSITTGGTFLSVKTNSTNEQKVSEILFRNGGHNPGTVSRSGSTMGKTTTGQTYA